VHDKCLMILEVMHGLDANHGSNHDYYKTSHSLTHTNFNDPVRVLFSGTFDLHECVHI
jgi:hypothetical protein